MRLQRIIISCSVILVLIAGCTDDDSNSKSTGGVSSSSGDNGSSSSGSGGQGGAGGMGGSGGMGGMGGGLPALCPADMAFVETFCMDRYEAPNMPGVDPLVMESALDGEAWCSNIGKRLCTEAEWVKACEGPQGYTYPYGDTHIDSQCNDDKQWIVVNETALNTWPAQTAQTEVDKLWQGAPSGNYAACVSGYGVYDLTGNIEEWVVRTEPHTNNYPHVLKGCYWAGCFGGAKPTCGSTNPAHASAFRYYETGFRCCKDIGP